MGKNISGNCEYQNITVAKKIIGFFDTPTDNISDYIDGSDKRLGQDVRYSVDDKKLKNIDWLPLADFDQELKIIVEYYKKNFIW